jgi:ribose 5-phosphate isomerase A
MGSAKELLANFILREVRGKKILGLGTGKTMRHVINRIKEEGVVGDFEFVCSSIYTELRVREIGGKVLSIYSGVIPEVYVDSFDVITHHRVLIKGGGGALLREKLLASASKKRIYLGEFTKVKESPPFLIPIEVVPASVLYVIDALKRIGIEAKLREGDSKMGPVITDNGNFIVDAQVKDEDLCSKHRLFKEVVGIVETGIFCKEFIDKIVLGDERGRIEVVEEG